MRSYQYTDYQDDRLEDGRSRWVAPTISAEQDVVYDPTTDTFEAAVAAGVPEARPIDGDGLVGLSDGRILDLRGRDGDGNAIPVRVLDPWSADPEGSGTPIDWPGHAEFSRYDGLPLVDGGALITGYWVALFDPRTSTVTDLVDPVPPGPDTDRWSAPTFHPCLPLPDGRALVIREAPSGSSLWMLDPGAASWSRLGPATLATSPLACTMLDGDHILVVTSDTSESVLAQAWILR